jgi:hypothetical protein
MHDSSRTQRIVSSAANSGAIKFLVPSQRVFRIRARKSESSGSSGNGNVSKKESWEKA